MTIQQFKELFIRSINFWYSDNANFAEYLKSKVNNAAQFEKVFRDVKNVARMSYLSEGDALCYLIKRNRI